MSAAYDPDNVFARILRGELPCDRVYEDEQVLAFRDIAPQAPVHIVIIPKGAYRSADDFSRAASDKEMTALMRAIARIAADHGLTDKGYRLIANHERDARQEVEHFHVHMLGGGDCGPLCVRSA